MAGNYRFTASSRIPCRPLSYTNKELAKPKELVIDYTNSALYVCNLNGELVDITNEFLKEVNKIIQDNLTNEGFKENVKNVIITLPDNTEVTIENAFISTYNKLKAMHETITNLNDEINKVKQSIPTASTNMPIASNDTGAIGTSTKMFALADHVHPKGKAATADSATKATQDQDGNNIKNTYATKNELNSYLPLSGGTVTGDVHLNATSTVQKLVFAANNYGTSEPTAPGAVGQIYLQLI